MKIVIGCTVNAYATVEMDTDDIEAIKAKAIALLRDGAPHQEGELRNTPDLLAACEFLLPWLKNEVTGLTKDGNAELRRIENIVARAKGES